MAKSGPMKFILSEHDLERIKDLKDHPFFKKCLAASYARIEEQVAHGITTWQGDQESHNKTHNYLNLLDMGLIYLLTGEKRFEEACVRDVMTFIKVGESNSENAMSESKIEQTKINKSLLFIYDWMRDSFTEKEQARIKKTILFAVPRHMEALGKWCVSNKLVQNHYLADAVGVTEELLYFNELPHANRWSTFTTELAIQYMKDAFYEDGVQNELSPSYHNFCLNLGITLAQTLKTYNRRDLFKEEWFRELYFKGLQWLSSLHTPDGGVVAFNDSHPTIASSIFRFGATLFQNSHFQWVADEFMDGNVREEQDIPEVAGRRNAGEFFYSMLYFDPTLEAKRDVNIPKIFSKGGTACFRKIKNNSESLLAQKCGRYTGGHAHADRLGFEYWQENTQVLIDPGIVNQSSVSGIGWYKSSTSHNVVAIYEPHELKRKLEEPFSVAHRNHRLGQGRFLKSIDNDNYSLLVSAAEIYEGISQTRILCWIKESGLLLIADKLENDKNESFIYDQLFHGKDTLKCTDDTFIFKSTEISLKGFTLTEGSEIVALNRPDGVFGPMEYAAVRKNGTSFIFSSIVIPFKSTEPAKPIFKNSEWQLGQDITFSHTKNTFKLNIGSEVLWES